MVRKTRSESRDEGATRDAHAGKPASNRQDRPMPPEFGGRKDGLEPTRYGDWEKNGRCIDF